MSAHIKLNSFHELRKKALYHFFHIQFTKGLSNLMHAFITHHMIKYLCTASPCEIILVKDTKNKYQKPSYGTFLLSPKYHQLT